MQTTELRTVKHRIQLGAPLPFNVRSADHTLLLARGQWVDSQDQLDSLFERGALVDLAELISVRDRVRQAPRHALPGLWKEGLSRINSALLHAPHHGFKGALDDATEPVLALVDRDPDLAIFQILRQNPDPNVAYGVQRSVNCAVTAFLVAHRLAWSTGDMERVFKIALTSNLSMLELQGELARQRKPPTEAQRRALQSHPERSCRMLAAAGIADRDWLQAVERHHEMEDGSGYPSGTSDVGDLASMVRRADVYTSKLASRSHRDALSADIAGRQMFMEDPGHPMTAALVKEFGVYPPGCHVRLVTGETAIVVQRGPTVTTPIVACLTTPQGAMLPSPVRRGTDTGRNAVASIVGQRPVDAEITADRLMMLTLR